MSVIFHVNPETGEVSQCHARISCGFKSGLHSDSEEGARKLYESTRKQDTLKSVDSTIKLGSLVNVELMNEMIEKGYVAQRPHPDDPDLNVLCYTPATQFDGQWNEATRMARGLIVRGKDLDNAEIVERPFEKFFTLSQVESGWHLGDDGEGEDAGEISLSSIDFDAPAEVTDKLDGSMGVLYKAPDGQPALSTKGSFSSDQAEYFTRMLRNDPEMRKAAKNLLQKSPNTTFLFEMTAREHRIVIDYGEEDKISMIAVVNKRDGFRRSVDEFDKEWADKGFPKAARMEAKTLREAVNLPPREGAEGMVVNIGGKQQIKIKQDDYLQLHKMASGVSKSDIRDALRSSKATYSDLIDYHNDGDLNRFPEISKVVGDFPKDHPGYVFIEERKDAFDQVLKERALIMQKTASLVEDFDISGDVREVRKAFAAKVNSKDFQGDKSVAFNFLKTRLAGRTIKDMDLSQDFNAMAKNI